MAWLYWVQLIVFATIPLALHTLSIQPNIQPSRQDSTETLDNDPYTGQTIERYSINETNQTDCNLTIGTRSAIYFKNILEIYHPNVVYFTLKFNKSTAVTGHTKEAIFPFNWVWTYYSPNGFFPYLKWPVDYPVLSLGLLTYKTFPKNFTKTVYLDVNATGNCSLIMGDPHTTEKIGYALRDMTKKYLLKLNPTEFSFTSWCFLEEVDGIKSTLKYRMATYFAFPIDFASYRCCRTGESKYTTDIMYVDCKANQIPHMTQVTITPYIISLVVFAFFPTILLSYNTTETTIRTCQLNHVQQEANEEKEEEDDQNEWVYLDGKPPITFTALIFSLFGLDKTHPVAVSRFRRLLFVLFGPLVLFIELWLYTKYQRSKLTMELLKHGAPMDYLSILGGFDKSMANFMPQFGGPYMLLLFYYIAGVLFLVIPADLGEILNLGCMRTPGRSHLSPLLLNENALEDLSGIKIKPKSSYSKAVAVCKGGFFMLANPKFWSTAVQIQIISPEFIVELSLCVLYYGVPLVSVIIMASKGYLNSILDIIIYGKDTRDLQRSAVWTRVWQYRVVRYFLAISISCVFILFIFNTCSIFTVSFSFLSKILAYSLLSVIVFPTHSFGLLFFAVAFVYYIFKLLKGFGEGYSELLADAVEASQQMEESSMHSQVCNGTVFLTATHSASVSRLQIKNSVINLSTEQRQRIKDASQSRLKKIREKNHTVGLPKDMFDALVRQFRPVHIQVTQSLLWLVVVLSLIQYTISIIEEQPQQPAEAINEMMHVMFVTIIGALPELLGVLLDRSDHSVKKEIRLKKIKAAVCEYWRRREAHN